MDENVQKNGQPSLKDGRKMIYFETINQTYMEKYLDYFAKVDVSYTATRTQRNRSECRLKEFRNYPDHNGRPKNTRPNFTLAVETAMTFSKEEWWVPDLRKEEKERMYDKLDPKTMEHLIWLSKNWASDFKETENSSSAPSWSRPSSWWDQSLSDRHQWTEWQEQPWKKQEWHERE